jgi:hypothetical protein
MMHTSFLKQLEDKLRAIHRVHLSLYDTQTVPFVTLSRALANNVARLFLIHLSLLDMPLSENARLKLTNEMTQVEYSISSSIFPVDKLASAVHKEIKVFRKLLFLDDTSQLDEEIQTVLDPFVLIHHLLSRAKIRVEKHMNISVPEYAEFLLNNMSNRKAVYKVLLSAVPKEQEQVHKMIESVNTK